MVADAATKEEGSIWATAELPERGRNRPYQEAVEKRSQTIVRIRKGRRKGKNDCWDRGKDRGLGRS